MGTGEALGSADRVDPLTGETDISFRRREWVVERAGGVAALLLVLAALLGLTGSGWLSRGTTGEPGAAVRVDFARFERQQSPSTLRVELQPEATSGGQVELWLDRAFLSDVQIESIDPEPAQVRAGPDRTTYVFDLAAPGTPAGVTFHLRHDRPGLRSAQVGVGDEPPLAFHQIVYP